MPEETVADAVAPFETCLRRGREWPGAEVNLGIAYSRVGDNDAAKTAFESAVEHDPRCVEALKGLAALAISAEQYDSALDYHARLIDMGERSPELFYNTGLLLANVGQLDDAVRLYNEALAERPDFVEALVNLGHVLNMQGNVQEANRCWDRAAEIKRT